MLCDKCGKKIATVFYESFGAQGKEKRALCDSCAKTAIPSEKAEKKSFFSSLFPPATPREDSVKEERRCPVCGMSLSEITKSGLCGCPSCYTAFENELTPTLRALHDALQHTGRMPERVLAKRERRERLAGLRAQLKQAVAEEEYEQCPALRDAIRALLQSDPALAEGEKARYIS